MKAVVIGGNGQLGSDVCTALRLAGHEAVGLTHEHIEISDIASVDAVLTEASPDVVVNTAAMHNVDACQREPHRAFEVNALGARNLATVTRDLGARLVHISTDYVFDGSKKRAYLESDVPRPLNVYGVSKLAGEHLALAESERVYVLRVSGLYGRMPCRAKGGLNFVQLMLKLGREKGEVRVVSDERVTPTCTEDVARQVAALVKTDHFGLYHATSQGECSWHEFAVEIFRLADLDVRVHEASSGDFPKKVARPSYSVLDNRALGELGLDVMPHWRDALARYLNASDGVPSLPSLERPTVPAAAV